MPTKLCTLISVVATVLALPPASALGADYCIKQSGGSVGGTYVGIGFAIPKAGECATWRGFCSSGCSPDNVQTGVACTASNGSHVSFGLTIFYLASNRQFDWIRLDLPSETGSGNFNYENPALGTTNYSAKGASCPAEPVR